MTNNVELVIKRTLNASAQEVFKAWTDPTQLAEWYGPEGFVNTVHEMDVKEGGAYSLTMKAPNGEEHPLRGVFKEVNPPHRLSMTWQWQNPQGMEGMGDETLVTVELKEADGKTEMTMTHSGFADEKAKENHNMGWQGSMNKLEKMFG